MTRSEILATASRGLAVALALFANAASVRAADVTDVDKIKAAVAAYHDAIQSLDVAKMEPLWAHDSDVVAIQPRAKAIAVGWEDVKKAWAATLGVWSDIKVTEKDGPYINVEGDIAWSNGVATVSGHMKAGDTIVDVGTFETDVFAKRGGAWLLVSHTALRVP